MKRIIYILLLLTAHAQAQLLTNLTYTLGSDGRYYANITYTQGADGRYYASVAGGAVTPWQIPEKASSVLYYKFDEATNSAGKVVDSSAIGTNTGTWGTFGAGQSSDWFSSSNGISSLAYFSGGINGEMDLGNKPYFNFTNGVPFTIQLWVTDESSGNPIIFYTAKDGTGQRQWSLSNYGDVNRQGQLSFVQYGNINGSAYVARYTPAGVVGKQHSLVTVTYDGASPTNNFYIYVNTSRVDTTTAISGSMTAFANGTASAKLNGRAVGDYRMLGKLDNFIIWTNKALSQAQVLDIYTNTYQYHGWSNSLAISNPSLYSNTVAEYLFDYNYPADTSYIGTNHLALAGGSTDPAWRADGTNGYYEFDGTSDYMTGNGHRRGTVDYYATNITFSCWLNYSSNSSALVSATALYYGGRFSFTYILFNEGYSAGLIKPRQIGIWTDTTLTAGNLTPEGQGMPTNKWTMFTYTFDKNATPHWVIYTNGISIPLAVTNDAVEPTIRSDQTNYFGTWNDELSRYYKGSMDSIIRLNDKTMTSNEVFDLYNSTKSRYGL
jgi:hypothetical protein